MTTLDLTRPIRLNINVAAIQDQAAREAILDLQRAVEQLQDQLMAARKAASDGLPADNQVCEKLGGVFLRLVSKGFPDLLQRRLHQLGRVPQGCIFTRERSGLNECLIEGDRDLDILPATSEEVTFVVADIPGQIVIALVF